MASVDKHLDQYNKNIKLLEEDCFNINNSKYLDWVVTITFYAAVHLIEKHLAEIPLHSRNHNERNRSLSNVDKLKPISSDYYTLYMESRKARYECTRYNTKKVSDIMRLLSNIEKHLVYLKI